MRGFVRFLTYNNAVPIAVSFLVLGGATTFAATNPELIVSKEEQVLSIDNTYIAAADFDRFSPTIVILSVTEDDETFYIEYEFTTIALVDYVWQHSVTNEIMEVKKEALGGHRDLGVFVTKQLNEKIKAEKKRLVQTQEIEREQISYKKVATKYSGIVGGMLTDKVTTIDGYEPVVKPAKEVPETQTFARPDPNAKPKIPPKPVVVPVVPKEIETVTSTTTEDSSDTETDTSTTTATTSDEVIDNEDTGGSGGSGSIPNNPPTVTVLGSNPVRVEIGASYTDLGATVTDDHDTDLSVNIYLDGELVNVITIDTTIVANYTVTYKSTDLNNAVAEKTRTIEVYDPTVGNSDNENTGGGDVTDPVEDEETATSSESTDSDSEASNNADTSTDEVVEPEETDSSEDTVSTEQQTDPDPEPTPEPEPDPDPESESDTEEEVPAV